MSVFETERLNYADDVYAIHSIPIGRDSQRHRRTTAILLASFGFASCMSVILSIVAVVRSGQALQRQNAPGSATPTIDNATTQQNAQFQPTRKVAFGSCSAFDLRPQPIWTEGVIPAQPDAWIWVGDMAYLDTPPVSCDLLGPSLAAQSRWCNCSGASSYITLPGQCMAGDVDAATERWVHAIHNPDYRAFLDFMCPPTHGSVGAATTSTIGAEPGRFPPTGTDPAVCPRPIMGVYDDHDYGWNNGDRRMPKKAEFKRMFLDAVGEAPDSTRRGGDSGLQAAFTLNGGGPDRDIDVVLLDERWYRDPMPCEMRRDWCQSVVLPDPSHPRLGWCRDFLLGDGEGATGRGSCCSKDQELAAWCSLPSSRAHPLYGAACNVASSEWGRVPLVVGADNTSLVVLTGGGGGRNGSGSGSGWDELTGDQLAVLWPRLVQARDSPVCEVLGAAQRTWLYDHLTASSAPVHLLVSGSVPLGGVGYKDPDTGNVCSGDDWNCWQPAQLNFLHSLANASSGCVVLLTGDYHYGDIKVVAPGGETPYAATLQTNKIKKHMYQVMSSGMTSSTAQYDGTPCEGTFREDLLGLRPLGRCGITTKPNFGMVEVDWEAGVVHLTIRNAAGGDVATTQDSPVAGTGAAKLQHVAFSLQTCKPVAV
ncbi:hypothetical protein VOLCADRAFT_91850 [Volvox carteri f. nagariensis]|uniref:PhoD-like phosphatase metallophosphatase domain-containing protein n=1 Tax=Volvox carteri f. nagariensis TaxID=3068 RepID=D8TY44_VOLCA|nr:uncharacterized protein VOLCADRAFT_91850 [Volvox carteri f. nagariensis]EFJ47581.1 hypothetical protein VOLCADRAFT_91850 [Volvox carteri f. nagariensis]|eukprot:XP_002951405.1 hypothetical protein VOLCADRAFT_91850 [Volvox carteri f. nagariensis]